MELTVETLDGGVRCVHLSGRLDLKGTQGVEPKFNAEVGGAKQSVIIEMSKVDYIASIGIRLLLSNVKTLTAAHAKMVILKPQQMVEDVLKMAGLDAVIPIEHDVETAVEMLR
jgi:anti-anti-sigma factor